MEQEYAIVALVIVITVGTTATEIFKQYMKSKSANKSGQQTEELNLLRQQNNELKQRIATLEKIVTEPEYELKQQINSL